MTIMIYNLMNKVIYQKAWSTKFASIFFI